MRGCGIQRAHYSGTEDALEKLQQTGARVDVVFLQRQGFDTCGAYAFGVAQGLRGGWDVTKMKPLTQAENQLWRKKCFTCTDGGASETVDVANLRLWCNKHDVPLHNRVYCKGNEQEEVLPGVVMMKTNPRGFLVDAHSHPHIEIIYVPGHFLAYRVGSDPPAFPVHHSFVLSRGCYCRTHLKMSSHRVAQPRSPKSTHKFRRSISPTTRAGEAFLTPQLVFRLGKRLHFGDVPSTTQSLDNTSCVCTAGVETLPLEENNIYPYACLLKFFQGVLCP